MIGSAATAAAGLGVFVVSGSWLDDAHGVSTGGLGVIAAGFGVEAFPIKDWSRERFAQVVAVLQKHIQHAV
jgi:hypothetical protein